MWDRLPYPCIRVCKTCRGYSQVVLLHPSMVTLLSLVCTSVFRFMTWVYIYIYMCTMSRCCARADVYTHDQSFPSLPKLHRNQRPFAKSVASPGLLPRWVRTKVWFCWSGCKVLLTFPWHRIAFLGPRCKVTVNSRSNMEIPRVWDDCSMQILCQTTCITSAQLTDALGCRGRQYHHLPQVTMFPRDIHTACYGILSLLFQSIDFERFLLACMLSVTYCSFVTSQQRMACYTKVARCCWPYE